MPRTLPWLVGAASKADTPKGSRVRKRAEERRDPDVDGHDLDDGFSTPKRRVDEGHCMGLTLRSKNRILTDN